MLKKKVLMLKFGIIVEFEGLIKVKINHKNFTTLKL